MSRSMLIVILAAGLCLPGCNRARKEARLDNAPQLNQMISALRGAYAAFNRGDIEAALEPLDAQIEWSEPAEFPEGGTYHGHDGVRHYLTHSREAWAEGRSEPEEFIPAGDRIVVFVHARVRAKGSSEWQDVRLADVYTISNGKAIQMRAFADRTEALRWVGAEGSAR
jgi:uncharacterized protein